MRLRKRLAKSGMDKDAIEQIVSAARGVEKKGLSRLPTKAAKRICALLDSVGRQCVVVRTPAGVRVFEGGAMDKLSLKAKREKPWLKVGKPVENGAASQVPA